MENNPEVIRREMQDTRNALTDKLEALEQHVLGTVQNATCAVQETVTQVKDAVQGTVCTVKESIHDTVGTVKESMDDTIGSVKETLDLELQVRRHPWTMIGGAVCAGYVGGKLLQQLGAPSNRQYHAPPAYAPAASFTSPGASDDRVAERMATSARSNGSSTHGWGQSMLSTLEPEIDKLKGLAVGALFNVVKDLTRRWVPHNIEPQMDEFLDGVTRKMGGQPVRGSLMEELQAAYK